MTSEEKVKKFSKMSNEWRCYICHAEYGLDLHHCLHGNGRKSLADEDGLFVALCRYHHRRLHDFGENDSTLKALAQRAYVKEHSREEFLARYGKYYD